jgi:hypothetical protein
MRKLDLFLPNLEHEGEYLHHKEAVARGQGVVIITMRDAKGEILYFPNYVSLHGLLAAIKEASGDGYRVRIVLRTHEPRPIHRQSHHRSPVVDWAVGRYLKSEPKSEWSWSLAEQAIRDSEDLEEPEEDDARKDDA